MIFASKLSMCDITRIHVWVSVRKDAYHCLGAVSSDFLQRAFQETRDQRTVRSGGDRRKNSNAGGLRNVGAGGADHQLSEIPKHSHQAGSTSGSGRGIPSWAHSTD